MLMRHQAAALERYEGEAVIPLFFDPGLGKTYTSIAIADRKFFNGDIDAVLVIAPNGVDKQWANQEIPKWCESDYTIYNNKKSKKPIPFTPGKLNFCCVNIDQFSTISSYVRYVEWANAHNTMIVLDEATRIKNPKAKRTERLLYEFNTVVKRGRAIISSVPKTRARIILTGTPITNGLCDVWSMFEFLEPGYFGLNWYAFQNKYEMFHAIDVNGRMIRIPVSEDVWKVIKACNTYEQANMLYGVTLDTYDVIKSQQKFEGPYKHVEQLRQLMVRNAMFVKIEDVQDMPERTYIKRMVDMSPEQSRVYSEMEAEMIAQYNGKEVTAKSKLTMYLRLQQIASGFVVPEAIFEGMTEEEMLEYLQDPKVEPEWVSDTKIKQLMLDLEELKGEPVIIVTHFSAEAQALYEALTKEGYRVCLQTGFKRAGTIDGFQAGEFDILLANIKVISMGFNLQRAHYMFFYSNTFSLEDRIQVEARIYRTGQKNRCIYYDYISTNTIDMKVLAALRSKKTLSDYVRDKSAEECLVGWDKECQEVFSDIVF